MSAIEIVRLYYERFNQKDWEGMLTLLHPNVRHDSNQGGTHYGLDYYRDFLTHMDACYDETVTQLTLFEHESGSRAAAEFVIEGIYKKTDGSLPPARGQKYALPVGAFLELDAGKIKRVSTYYNLPLWIKLISE